MYCTVKEIIRDVLDTDVPDSECVFAVVLTRGDVRHIAQDWNLSDDELETVMQRLDDGWSCDDGADRWSGVVCRKIITPFLARRLFPDVLCLSSGCAGRSGAVTGVVSLAARG